MLLSRASLLQHTKVPRPRSVTGVVNSSSSSTSFACIAPPSFWLYTSSRHCIALIVVMATAATAIVVVVAVAATTVVVNIAATHRIPVALVEPIPAVVKRFLPLSNPCARF